jgi:arsenate reductase
MAEGLWRHWGGDRFEVYSAGTRPTQVRAEAVAVMQEIGIDISAQGSKSVDEFRGRDIDLVVTVCDHARETCPVFPAITERLHWPFADPAAVQGSETERLAAFRETRDQIEARLRLFLDTSQ